MGNRLGRILSLSLVAAAFAWAAPPAHAEDVFLIVSVPLEFNTNLPESSEDDGYDGSEVLVVQIGTLTDDVTDPLLTQFDPAAEPTVPLGEEVDLTDLDGNESTIFGSYSVMDFSEQTDYHLVTPGIEDIDPAIQAAVFAASPGIAALAGGPSSTGEIVDEVMVYLGDTGITRAEVAEALFGSTAQVGVRGPEGDFACEAEGELFPHPDGVTDPIFVFGFSFGANGALTNDFFTPADVEVKESSVNLKKKGTVSVAIYDSDELETDDIIDVQIHGVSADKIQFAKNKATAQFSVPDLVDAFGLTPTTTQVLVVITLSDYSQVAGVAEINVK